MRRRAVILMREKYPWERAFWYMENTVKMQAARFRGAFPYTDVFPPSALGKRGQPTFELLAEGFFGMLLIVVGERAKIVKVL